MGDVRSGLGSGGWSRDRGWSIGRGWLGVGVDVGYGGCEQRIEGIVQCTA